MTDQGNSSPEEKENKDLQFRRFIESNQQYLKEKYNQHFSTLNKQKDKPSTIDQIAIDKLFHFIIQIFQLERYLDDKKISEKIKISIEQNLKQYLTFDSNSLQRSQKQLNFLTLMSLLSFIVQRNNIFSIQYEKKGQGQLGVQGSKDKNLQVGIRLQKNPNNLASIINNDSSQPQLNKSKLQNSFSLMSQNQFEISTNNNDEIQKVNEQRLIKKNTRALFDFYCRQQMQLGGLITFDRLNEETSSMSLGKCLTFAKATKIYNQFIKRDDLVAKFKKISQGKKYIDYDKFQRLMAQFQAMDSNFSQRIGLLTNDIRKVLKYVKLPFNTKDIQPREKIAVRNFSSKLTQHSGQTSEELKIQLEQKKQQVLKLKKLKQFKEYMLMKQTRPQLIRQTDLKSSKGAKNKDLTVQLSFIGSIIHPEEDDETYLKDHVIPRLEKQTQKVQKYGNVFETQRYRSLDKLTLRKQSVVDNIRRRISQIESHQRLSLASKMKRSQQFLQSPKKRSTPK